LLLGEESFSFVPKIVRAGLLPVNYKSFVIPDPLSNSINISELDTGSKYFVRVRSINSRGISVTNPTIPLYISPGEKPGSPNSPLNKPYNQSAILVT